jgi:SAM-dependent methyltransferase
MELSQQDPTGRFTGLAAVYARSRPDYPAAAIDHILERSLLQAGALLVDVGCGTGISSRLFAARGLRIIGIEPNAEMRRQAEAQASGVSAEYREGRAEATDLDAGCADAVLAAQAFHWFQAEAALLEFHRILKAAGWIALMWNERDESEPFTAAYGEVIRTSAHAAALEQARHRSGDCLLTCPLFAGAGRAAFAHEQILDEEGVVGRALSVSYAPPGPEQRTLYESRLRNVFARFQRQGRVVMQYRTTVYTARRKDVSSA